MVFHPDDCSQELWRLAFNRAISRLEYGDASEHFMQSFTALSDHEVFDWSHAVRWMKASGSQWQEIFAEVKTEDVPAANLALKKALICSMFRRCIGAVLRVLSLKAIK